LSPAVVVAGTASVPALILFVVVERRVRAPMLPLELFASRPLRIAFAFAFAFMIGWMGCIFVVSLYLQQQLGLSAAQAGLVFIPSGIASGLCNLWCGALVSRLGVRIAAVLGMVPMIIGFVGLAVVIPTGSVLGISLLVMLMATGGALASPAIMGLMLTNASARFAGVASGAFNSFRQVGGALAVAGFGLLIADRTWFVEGAQWSFICSAVCIGGALLFALRIRRTDERAAEPAQQSGMAQQG
jgi:MFS transporter, DHA2 family, methylenomycin A resistance protein